MREAWQATGIAQHIQLGQREITKYRILTQYPSNSAMCSDSRVSATFQRVRRNCHNDGSIPQLDYPPTPMLFNPASQTHMTALIMQNTAGNMNVTPSPFLLFVLAPPMLLD